MRVTVNGDAPRLSRLLPRARLRRLLEPVAALTPGLAWRLVTPAGDVHVEGGDGAGAGDAETRWGSALRGALALQGVTLATLEVLPGAGAGARAAFDALLGVLEHALEATAAQRELVAETLERYREVHLAYRLSELLAVEVDVAGLPARVMHEALRVVDAPCAAVVLGDDVVAAAGIDAGDVGLASVLAAVAARAEGRTRIDTEPLDSDAALERVHAVRLWAPLTVGEERIGALLLTRPAGAAVFAAGDAKLLSALAALAAAVVQNARLHAAALAQARLARELQLAHDVQAKLMPSSLPTAAGWSLAAWWSAAREVAGDFYDATRHGDGVAVTVGDVADKGMAAALFMALTRSVLRASGGDGRGSAEVVERANALLCADASDGMFVTLVYAQLRPDGTVRYANAGHNPPLLQRADGQLERLGRTGMLVGWDEHARFGEASATLAPGDALLLYSDGVTEARDAHGAEYGEARLEALLRDQVAAGAEAAAIVAALRSDLAAFVGDAEPFDDATLLVAVRDRHLGGRVVQAGPAGARPGGVS